VSSPRAGFLREALFNGNGVAKKLIVALILFSTVITTVITAFDLNAEYRRGVRQIEGTFALIDASYRAPLVEDVWVSDNLQVQTTVDGLRLLPDIEAVRVIVDGAPKWAAGEVVSTRTRMLELPLLRQHRGQQLDIGTLQVTASVDRVIERLWDQLLVIVVANGIKTLLVAGFLLLVFQWLVTRHLMTIANFVRSLDPRSPRGEQVQLQRSATGTWRPDVLDAVTGAINDMSHRLAQAQAGLIASEARYRAIVEAQDDAVCRWLPDTRLTFTNARYRELRGLTEHTAADRKWLEFVPANERERVETHYAQLVRAPRRSTYEHTVTTVDGRELWMAWADIPLFDEGGRLVEFQSVGRDISERKRDEDALRRAHRVLEALTECNQAIVRADDEGRLLHDVCRIAVEFGGYRMAWIGFAENDEARTVRPVASVGDHDGYLASIRVSWGDNERGRGPTGTAIRERCPAVARDIAHDPRFAPWREAASRLGYASSIALPLLADDGRCFAALNMYAAEPDAFDTDEVNFLARLASDLSYGLRALRDRAARALAEDRLRLALEAAQQGIYDLNVQTGEATVSAEYATMLGYDPATFRETNAAWIARLHPDDRAPVAATYRDYIAGRLSDYRVEFRQRTRSGEWKWILSIGKVVARDASGAPLRMLGTHTDITDRRNAEEALRELNQTLEQRVRERTDELRRSKEQAEQANRAKSEFLSRMSHELRTPLNAILGFSQVLELSNPTTEQRGWAQQIRRAGDYLLSLIDELLDLSRIEVGKLALQIEPKPLEPIVREAVAFVQPAIARKGIALVLQSCAEPPIVQVDALRLRQILVNLLSNAIKYNRVGGRIEIACELPRPGRVRLLVSDTGAGIASEHSTRLFKPFERLGAENSGIEGTGIGLALSRQLAHMMDGEIGFDSTIGVGTTFWIDLPGAAQAASSSAPPAAPALSLPPGVAGTVLYIEDNASNLALVQSFLQQFEPLRLLSATQGAQGLAIARAQRPDVILLDIQMPQMDGFAVLRELRADASLRDVPVIALSADAMPDDIARALASGFSRYLTKPLVLVTLLDALSEALSRRAGR